MLFVALCVVSLPIFWRGLVSLLAAWGTPEYSYGPLIPLIALYLFLRQVRRAPPPERTAEDWRRGVAVIAAGLALAVIGHLSGVADIVSYGFVVWLGGVVLTIFGWSGGMRRLLPVAYLVFMLPWPQILYGRFIILFSDLTSELSVWFLSLSGVPVFLDGRLIDLGVYALRVAEVAGGVRYVLPVLSLACLFAVLYRGPAWHRVLFVLAPVPLVVAMNAARIAVAGLLAGEGGPEEAEAFLRLSGGWALFLACVLALLVVVYALHRARPGAPSFAEAFDLRARYIDGVTGRLFSLVPTPAMALATLLTAAVSITHLVVPGAPPTIAERRSFDAFPTRIGTLVGTSRELERGVTALGADDYLNITFDTGVAPDVHLFAAFYRSQADGAGIVAPEAFLQSGGAELLSFGPHRVSVPDTAFGTFEVNRAVIRRGRSRQLVYFWFEQRGKRLLDDVTAKSAVILDSVVMGRSDGALVRFATPIRAGESEADADGRLADVMAEVVPILPDFIPK